MTNRKAMRRARRIRRTVLTVCLMALVAVLSIGGTIAWLTAQTGTVTNTFTVGDINIKLEETGTDTSGNKSYKMVPGETLSKDPKVTVEAGSEACYVFVKVEEANSPDTYLTYSISSAWTALDGVTGVYYIEQVALTAENAQPAVYSVLTNDQVVVKSENTKAQLDALETANTYPTLKFTAYAVQSANLTDQNNDNVVDAKDAWKLTSQN